jgi:hypothetical protein
MSKYLFLFAFVFALSLSGLTNAVSANSGDSARFFDLSLPQFDLHPFEQVTEISCMVNGGWIAQVSIPSQWNTNVDSSLGDRARLTAFAVVGASAFYQPELAPLHAAFLTITKDPPGRRVLSFEVAVVLTITNNDSGHERKLTFSKNQLILTETAKRSSWW